MASYGEFEEMAEELRACKGTTPPADKLIKFLRLAREVRVRCSDAVSHYGSLLLKSYKGKLSEEELWLVHEQVHACDCDCVCVCACARACECAKYIREGAAAGA